MCSFARPPKRKFKPDNEYGDGVIFTVIAGLAILFCIDVFRKRSAIGYLIMSIIAFFLMTFEVNDYNDTIRKFGFLGVMVSKGAGYHLLVCSTVLMLVSGISRLILAIIYRRTVKKNKKENQQI